MSRQEEFDQGGVQVTYEGGYRGHMYTARKGGEEVGWLNLEDSGEVQHIATHHAHRRQGIATAMWDHAVHHANTTGGEVPWPIHSTDRTYEGNEWAKSLGEELPPLYRIGDYPTPPNRKKTRQRELEET